ncbi:hypothetical protein HAX54_011030 [Datura stramonium]|uniref:Uncharacterized protein n=1 Tax=Datura stramonium TaxID=4076 RepID=A0ABS8TH71_DATST|nr:hypothetical protein [Datura stramonium]
MVVVVSCLNRCGAGDIEDEEMVVKKKGSSSTGVFAGSVVVVVTGQRHLQGLLWRFYLTPGQRSGRKGERKNGGGIWTTLLGFAGDAGSDDGRWWLRWSSEFFWPKQLLGWILGQTLQEWVNG